MARGAHRAPRAHERGFSLMEAMVAALIAIVAVIGLAYSFGLGHGLIDRYAGKRAALGEAQRQMSLIERLVATRPDSDSLRVGGPYPGTPIPFSVPGVASGSSQWTVDWYDDPATTSTSQDLKLLTLFVVHGTGREVDTITITRLIPKAP